MKNDPSWTAYSEDDLRMMEEGGSRDSPGKKPAVMFRTKEFQDSYDALMSDLYKLEALVTSQRNAIESLLVDRIETIERARDEFEGRLSALV